MTKRTQEIVAKAAAEGITPLEYLLARLRNPKEKPSVRLQCAREAAPYMHPRLAAVEHSGGMDVGIRGLSDAELDAEIQRLTAAAAGVTGTGTTH